MNKVAIAFLTKDRVELSKRTIVPLLQPDKFDTFWVDGSVTVKGQTLPGHYNIIGESGPSAAVYYNVRGGPDAAIVFALSALLAGPEYDYVGLCENDVLLHDDWFEPTFSLFAKGRQDGLRVGAVSARCYEDRVLIQTGDYAIMHNLGAGMVIFSRHAAQLVLDNFRTTWSTENRKVFAALSGVDIGSYWAFQGSEQWLTADWGFDKTLASYGLASLALNPARCEMIGQTPSLEQQGLRLATGAVPERPDPNFSRYVNRLALCMNGSRHPNVTPLHQDQTGTWTVFPHQIPLLGGTHLGDWRLKWTQGFGPFSYRANEAGAQITIPIFGSCTVMVGGGKEGAMVEVADAYTGFRAKIPLEAEGSTDRILAVEVPSGYTFRDVILTAITPGVVFYGLTLRERQPWLHPAKFRWDQLPKV